MQYADKDKAQSVCPQHGRKKNILQNNEHSSLFQTNGCALLVLASLTKELLRRAAKANGGKKSHRNQHEKDQSARFLRNKENRILARYLYLRQKQSAYFAYG